MVAFQFSCCSATAFAVSSSYFRLSFFFFFAFLRSVVLSRLSTAFYGRLLISPHIIWRRQWQRHWNWLRQHVTFITRVFKLLLLLLSTNDTIRLTDRYLVRMQFGWIEAYRFVNDWRVAGEGSWVDTHSRFPLQSLHFEHDRIYSKLFENDGQDVAFDRIPFLIIEAARSARLNFRPVGVWFSSRNRNFLPVTSNWIVKQRWIRE